MKTCFAEHARRHLPCLNSECRMWFENDACQNCTLVAVAKNEGKSMTLQEIGDMHGLTRMRVCQIEKRAKTKVKNHIFADEKDEGCK